MMTARTPLPSYGRQTAMISLKELACSLSRSVYAESCGFTPHPWQRDVLEDRSSFKIINGARQSGKSTIIAVVPAHKAKYRKGSLSLVIAPTRAQAAEDIAKIKGFILDDPTYPELKKCSSSEIALANGSRIIVVTATDKAARGYSAPDVIVVDEASRVLKTVYTSAILPMQTASPEDFELILISTPFGKSGFFWDCWNDDLYHRYMVRAPWAVDERMPTKLFKGEPEEAFTAGCARDGIRGYYSPQHRNEKQQTAILRQQGTLIYQQEFLCAFVDRNDAVFRQDDLDRAFFPAENPRPFTFSGHDEDWSPSIEPLRLSRVPDGEFF